MDTDSSDDDAEWPLEFDIRMALLRFPIEHSEDDHGEYKKLLREAEIQLWKKRVESVIRSIPREEDENATDEKEWMREIEMKMQARKEHMKNTRKAREEIAGTIECGATTVEESQNNLKMKRTKKPTPGHRKRKSKEGPGGAVGESNEGERPAKRIAMTMTAKKKATNRQIKLTSGERAARRIVDGEEGWFKTSRNRTVQWLALVLRLIHIQTGIEILTWSGAEIVVRAPRYERRMGMTRRLSNEFLRTMGVDMTAGEPEKSRKEVMALLHRGIDNARQLLNVAALHWIEHGEGCTFRAADWDVEISRKDLSKGDLQRALEEHTGILCVKEHTKVAKRKGNLVDALRWLKLDKDGGWVHPEECVACGCRRAGFLDYNTWDSKSGMSVERGFMPSVLCGWLYAKLGNVWVEYVNHDELSTVLVESSE